MLRAVALGTYQQRTTATTRWSTAAAGAAGSSCPPCRSGCGTTSATTGRTTTQRAIVRRAFDLGITHFDLANNYGPPYGSAEVNFGRMLVDDLRAVPRRAGDLDEGRLRHVARTLRRVGLAQVPAGVARPVAGPDGPRLRRHLLLPSPRPGHAAGGDDGRARHRGALRTGALRRHLLVQLGAHAGGGGDPARARHAAADPPAVVLDDQPLDRGRRPARHPGGGRRRVHRLLAARPGSAHRPLPRRRAGRLAGRHRRGDGPRHADRRAPRPRPGPQRCRRAPRPDARPAGARLGAARPADDVAGDRREQRRPARGQRRAHSTSLDLTDDELAEIDRLATRRRHQPVGPLEQA